MPIALSLALMLALACSGGAGDLVPTPAPDPVLDDAVRVDAPIESIEIHKSAAKTPNAFMTVVTGLRNGCESFNTYSLQRTGDLFSLTVVNESSIGPDVACTDNYRIVTTEMELAPPIEACKQYTVVANGVEQEVLFTHSPFLESESLPCPA